MNLPQITDLDNFGKKVLVRGDLDVEDKDNPRAESVRNVVRFLQSQNVAKIKVIGHRETDYDLASQLKTEFPGVEFDSGLRNHPGEKANSLEFARQLANGWEIYVNEAFAVSHRQHTSIVGVPKLLPHVAGLRFAQEIENLSKVSENPKKPLVIIIAGVKEDKLSYIEPLSKIADEVLIAGRLPEFIQSSDYHLPSTNVIVADLLPDREDITIRSMEKFEEEIKKAGTIVLAGPIGKYEDFGHKQGTERIFRAVADSNAFKVAGGGDTEKAIGLLSLANSFSWISVGGGAMLEFLAKKTLPGIEALIDK